MESIRTLDRQKLVQIAKQHGIVYLALFGSYARGEASSDSDIDLYVRFEHQIGLFDMLSVKYIIEDNFERNVDLIAEGLVEPYEFVRRGMDKDRIVLYESEK